MKIGNPLSRHRSAILLGTLVVVMSIAGCGTKPDSPDHADDGTAADSSRSSNTQDITFAQITDAHLFDAGKKRHGQGVFEESLDNRAALHWAILEINRIDATVRRLNFVVFTGDWGLENVRLTDDSEQRQKCKCPPPAGTGEGPVPSVLLDVAVSEVATELRALVVSNVFLVPGTNDICNGDPRDLHRYAEFVLKLQEHFPGRVIRDLTHSAEVLNAKRDAKLTEFLRVSGSLSRAVAAPPPAGEDEVLGFHLLGMNSASFEQRSKYDLIGADAPGHPDYEIGRVQAAIANGQSYLIFTHVPDLKDPAPGPQPSGSRRPAAVNQPAWDLNSRDIQAWEDKIVGRTEVLGVFAGHLHSSDRSMYGAASEKHPLAVRTNVAAKTWVAPPLAVKDQFAQSDSKTARGFLLATITGTGGASVQPYWYETLDQKAASEGDATLSEGRADARDGNWDDAAKKYAEAMKSSDSRVRASASQAYLDARAVTRTAWWQIGKYFPPLRWAFIHPWRMFVGFLLVLVLLVYIAYRRFSPFDGQAQVHTPKKLTETTNVDLFASQLSQGARDVADVLEWFGVNTFAGSVTLLALPTEVTQSLVDSFPDVGGVKINKVIAFLLAIIGYFGWRVESQVGFCPTSPAAPGGQPGPSGEMRVFASLRWGWFTKANWGLARPARDAYDMSRPAFALAARILWESFD